MGVHARAGDLASLLTYQPADQEPVLDGAEPREQAEPTPPGRRDAGPVEGLQGVADRVLSEDRFARVTVLWENDSRMFNPFDASDNYYTNGVRIHLSFAEEPEGSAMDQFIKSVWLPFSPDADKTSFALAITQEHYTPTDIRDPDRNTDERPYAGWLYASAILQRSSGSQLDTLEIKLGATGDYSGGESTQKFIHAALPEQDHPEGWDNQIDERFTFELDASRIYRTKIMPVADTGWQWQVMPELGTRLGNVRVDARASVLARIGQNMPDDFGPPRLRGAWDASSRWPDDFGWYVFGRAGAELVAYDLFIEGNSPGTRMHPDKEPLVGVFSAGAVLRYRAFHAGYTINWESDRFEGQNRWDSHGTWVFSWRFDF